MTKQTNFCVDNNKIIEISKSILQIIDKPIIVSELDLFHIPISPYPHIPISPYPHIPISPYPHIPISSIDSMCFSYVKTLPNKDYKESGAIWSFCITEEEFKSELVYRFSPFLDSMLLDKKHSPVFEYSPVFYKEGEYNANLKGRVALFYQGNNQTIINKYKTIVKNINKIIKSRNL